MRIAIFTDHYLPTIGGIQTSIHAQRVALEEQGHTVFIFAPLQDKDIEPNLIALPAVQRLSPGGIPLALPLGRVFRYSYKQLQNLNIDIVHSHTEMAAGVSGLVAAKKLGIPSVQTMHVRLDTYMEKTLPLPYITSKFYVWLHRHYIPQQHPIQQPHASYVHNQTGRNMWQLMVNQANYADHTVVPSKHFAVKLQEQGANKPVSILSNGLSSKTLFKVGVPKPRIFEKGKVLEIIWCGRISSEKRPLQFLSAIVSLKDSVRVTMIGDGTQMKEVVSYIADHDLQQTVRLCCALPQDEVLAKMRSHHIFVFTSYNFDNQPMVLLEAIASGLPIIYSDPDMAEIVPAKSGVCTDNPSPEALTSAIKTFIKNPGLINQMSQSAIASYHKITQNNHIQQLLALYANLVR